MKFWVLSYELNIAHGLECYVGVQAQVGFFINENSLLAYFVMCLLIIVFGYASFKLKGEIFLPYGVYSLLKQL